jgi:hypothetical protein
MLTFPHIIPLLYTVGISCQNDATQHAETLPPSVQNQEDWLNTSRQIRYSLNAKQSWQGWILHPITPAATVHILHFEHPPSSEEWLTCVRSYYIKSDKTNPIWVSSTPDNTPLTRTYASQLGTNLSIQDSDC